MPLVSINLCVNMGGDTSGSLRWSVESSDTGKDFLFIDTCESV